MTTDAEPNVDPAYIIRDHDTWSRPALVTGGAHETSVQWSEQMLTHCQSAG